MGTDGNLIEVRDLTVDYWQGQQPRWKRPTYQL